MSVQLTTPHLFRRYRWAAFRQVVDDTDKSVRTILSGDQNVKFLHHMGGAYYVSVKSGYRCVNLRKWFQPTSGLYGRHQTHKEGRVVESLQSRRRHQQNIHDSPLSSTLLLRRRSQEPAQLPKLHRVPPVSRQLESVRCEQCSID